MMIDTLYTGYADMPAAKVQDTAVYSGKGSTQTSFRSLLNDRINESYVKTEAVSEALNSNPESKTLLSEIQSAVQGLLEQIQAEDDEAYAGVIKRLLKLIDEITGDDVDYRSAMIMMADMLASSAGINLNSQSAEESEAIPDIAAVMASTSAQSSRVSTQINDSGTRPDIHLQESSPEQIESKTTGTEETEKEESAYITEAYPPVHSEADIPEILTEDSENEKSVSLENTASVLQNKALKETETIAVTHQTAVQEYTDGNDIGKILQAYPAETDSIENINQTQLAVDDTEALKIQAENPEVLNELVLSSGALSADDADSPTNVDEAAKELFGSLLKIAKEKSALSQTDTEDDLFVLSYPHELTAVKNTGRNPQNLSNLKNKPDEFTQLLKAVKGESEESTESVSKTANVPVQLQTDINLFESKLNAAFGETAENVQSPVANQLSDVISAKITALGNGETEFEMTLAPESLGKISIRLVTENGRVSVAITAERKETGELLQNRAEHLAQNLRQNGVELEKYTVYQEQGQEAYYNQDGKNGNKEQRREHESSDNESETNDENKLDFAELINAI